MSRSLEDLLLGDIGDEITDDAASLIGDKLVNQTPALQPQPAPIPTQQPQAPQPQAHPLQGTHITQMQAQNVNRPPVTAQIRQPQVNATQMGARVSLPTHGGIQNPNLIQGGQQVSTPQQPQVGQPAAQGAQIPRPGVPPANNNNSNNTKQQSFVRFMEIVKSKLPPDQCTSVGEIDKLFMEHKMSFEDYLAQLRAKIGKIKFELLLNQFKSLQHGTQKPAQPGQPMGAAGVSTGGIPPSGQPQTSIQSQHPQQQAQPRPPGPTVRYPLQMPGGGGVGVGAYSQGITQNPNLPNQPNPQGVVGTNNPNYLRRPETAVPVSLQNQKKRLEPSTPTQLQEPPNKKRVTPTMPPTRPPSQVNLTVTAGNMNQKPKQKDETDMKSFDDVTKIAKINLKEEQKLSLDDEQGPVMNYPSEGKETLFVNEPVIEKIVKDIAGKHNLTIGDQFVEYLALCLQEKLRGSMEQLISISKQRFDTHKVDFQIEETTDVKKTLRNISERERELALKKKEEDRERLLNAAKQNKKEKKDDKQSAFFRDKLNKVKQEEEEKRTNITALQAAKSVTPRHSIGQTGLFGNLKQDLPVYLRQIPNANMPNALPNQPSKITTSSITEVPRQPTRKITLKDALAYVERDVDLKAENSNFVYKCFLGEEFLKSKHDRVISN